ncbi:MAG: hypothetical protein R3277_02395 [Brumimicrobium sp.]|nr:hypothetical protein [Brumimicrobium sp.]
MKRLIAIIFCFSSFATSYMFSQTVRDIHIKEIDAKYIQIRKFPEFRTNKISIWVDFGQENNNKLFDRVDNGIKDENGNDVLFNSMIDALNFFSKYGFEFIEMYPLTNNDETIYYYILKRRDE